MRVLIIAAALCLMTVPAMGAWSPRSVLDLPPVPIEVPPLLAPYATVNTSWEWTAPPEAAQADPVNPYKYWFYSCSDPGLAQCTQHDAGTATMISGIQFASGTYWVYCTARQWEIIVDGVPGGQLLESGKSNIPKVQVSIPPGNPDNAKIRTTP